MSTENGKGMKSRCFVSIPWVPITRSIWLQTKVCLSVSFMKIQIYVNKQSCLTHTSERHKNAVETCYKKHGVNQHQCNSLVSNFHLSHTPSLLCCLSSHPKEQEKRSYCILKSQRAVPRNNSFRPK